MTAQIIHFPHRTRRTSIRVCRDEGGGWLVINHRGYAWSARNFGSAMAEACALARSLTFPPLPADGDEPTERQAAWPRARSMRGNSDDRLARYRQSARRKCFRPHDDLHLAPASVPAVAAELACARARRVVLAEDAQARDAVPYTGSDLNDELMAATP
jgi:hypothetical protein